MAMALAMRATTIVCTTKFANVTVKDWEVLQYLELLAWPKIANGTRASNAGTWAKWHS